MRGSRAQRLREPVLHLARGSARRARRTARRGTAPACPTAACAGRRRAGACRPRARGAGRARSPRGRRRRRAGARAARASSRDAPARRSASAALSIARSQGSRLSRWGMSTAGVGAHAARVGRLQPAHELEQRRLAAAAGADDGDDLAGADARASTPSSARTAPNARLTPARLAVPPPSTSRGSCAGASSLVVIAPSAGITPQVRRVSAGSLGAISAGLRQPPCLSVMDASAGARRPASPLR